MRNLSADRNLSSSTKFIRKAFALAPPEIVISYHLPPRRLKHFAVATLLQEGFEFSSFSVFRMSHGTSAKLPWRIIDDMRQQGGDYIVYGRGRALLHTFEVSLDDAVHHVYCTVDAQHTDPLSSGSGDPLIHFVPLGDDWGVIPHGDVQVHIIREVNSILVAYQPLPAHHLNVGAPIPALGPPVGLRAQGLSFHHSTIMAHAVSERISDPQPGFCPIISAQPTSTMLGALYIVYANAVICIRIPRA
ncbi:unnamed protein product [Calypogeia fissa]